MKFPLPTSKRMRLRLAIVSLLIILLALDLLWVRIDRRISIGYGTSRITSPLTPNGMPDYLRALNEDTSAGVTEDNNAARLLIPLFTPKSFVNGEVRTRIDAALHLPTPPKETPDTDTFISYDEYLTGQNKWYDPKSATELEGCTEKPWRKEDHPRVAAWLERNRFALETLRLAVKRPRCWVPYVTTSEDAPLMSVILPPLSQFRGLMVASTARAMLRVHDGDFPGALADLTAARQLSLLLTQGGTMLEYLTGTAMDAYVSRALRVGGTPLTIQQVQSLRNVANGFPEVPSSAHQLDLERYSILDSLTFVSRVGVRRSQQIVNFLPPNEDFSVGLSHEIGYVLLPSNFNRAMRLTNDIFDRWVSAAALPTYRRQRAAGELLEKEVGENLHRLRTSLFSDAANSVCSQLLPSFSTVFKRECAAHAERRLTDIALALAGYHANHGSYPDTLEALVPAWLPALPIDPFTDTPFRYEKTPAGYRLFSEGALTRREPDGLIVTVPSEKAAKN